MESLGTIYGINGPIINVRGCDSFKMSETVYVGESRLIGEVIKLNSQEAIVQVFENTAGLKTGEKVYGTGTPLSITLGPGIISNIFDGIERPLAAIEADSGVFIDKGVHVNPLDASKRYKTHITAAAGDMVTGGDTVAEVTETQSVTLKIMIPPNICGVAEDVLPDGEYTALDTLLTVTDVNGEKHEIKMAQKWPIRTPRPVLLKRRINAPLITGQRIIDTFFPIAKGGMAALPGGFGTGKTMNQHQIAKWSDADIVVYIGCGERGNEMTQVLEEFSELIDPRTGKSLMDRTVLIANTSNMPVAAREASIYTGITIAEYYRDMGYHVAVMADSTSRWAEALRELSGRLEEIPAEEGFPAYLASRLSAFYERAGYVQNLNGSDGSVTIIGAVSPQGGDFSEPVTQNTKRFVRCFWTLDRSLAYARHFPAINWLTSYSEYLDDLQEWYAENVSEEFLAYRSAALSLLQQESELIDIAKLIGADVLPDGQKLILEICRCLRLGFTQQNAYHKFDTYTPLKKQMMMLETILYLHEAVKKLVAFGIPIAKLKADGIFDELISMKYNIGNDEYYKFDDLKKRIDEFFTRQYELFTN